MRSRYNASTPIYFGRRFKPYVKQGYMSGGAGYVLSREALRRLIEDGLNKKVTIVTHSFRILSLMYCILPSTNYPLLYSITHH